MSLPPPTPGAPLGCKPNPPSLDCSLSRGISIPPPDPPDPRPTPRITCHNDNGREDLGFAMLSAPLTSSSLPPLSLPLPSLFSIEFLLATPYPTPEVRPCKAFL